MSEEETSIVLKPNEHFEEMVLSQNADELAKFMDEPLCAIAEAITGAMAVGPKEWMMSGGRIVQGIFKAKLFQQVGREVKQLRDRGKIPADFGDEKANKYSFKSWVELLTIIDEESPDPDRLEAIKAMFYAINKVNSSDGERIAAYQLFQIAKRLTSSQLLYLKVCSQMRADSPYPENTGLVETVDWLKQVAKRMGHKVIGLLDKDDSALIELNLIAPRRNPDGSAVHPQGGRLTELGIYLCQYIEAYQLEKESA